MVVIVLEKSPLALRGDLTKWLQEISPGVYVGQVSARVRDRLWERVCQEAKGGRATMVYSARNEQHLDFRVHNALWEPIDFDGIKLMLRPSASRLRQQGTKRLGSSFTKSTRKKAKRSKSAKGEPKAYVVVDVETTGLDVDNDSVIEIGAIRVIDGTEEEAFHRLICDCPNVPMSVERLTGITQGELATGVPLKQAMDEFVNFIGTQPLVMHNAPFDMGFVDAALEECDIDELENQCIDTLALAKKSHPTFKSFTLVDLCSYYELDVSEAHRAMADCRMTRELFVCLLND